MTTMRVMRSMRVAPILAGSVLAMFAAPAGAEPPPNVQWEIAQLIDALGRSGCQFQRNGTWYPASQAQAHLRRKYDNLRKRDLVDTSEQFIERAGTQSSISGKAYAVRCPGQGTVPSAQWLGATLSRLRHAMP